MELDREYTLNGDDLRIALAESGVSGKDRRPSDVAEYILARIARPSGGRKITSEQLAKAVDGMEITVDLTGGDVAPGTWTGAKIRYPDSFATQVFDEIGASAAPGDPEVAAIAALVPVLPLVSKLRHDARERVMDWARRRATDGLAPF